MFSLVSSAEAEGFEPPNPCGSLAFKASAFGRSATLPPRTVPADRQPLRRLGRPPPGLRQVTTETHPARRRSPACGVLHLTGRVMRSPRPPSPVRPRTGRRCEHAGQQEARMRFDENADLDTSNVDDLRG